MARKRVVEDHVSHERWLVSYADFITLLFAFFVVMYSISQVNDGKYRILSNTLSEAFNIPEEQLLSTPQLTLDPFQIGKEAKSNPRNIIELHDKSIVESSEQTDKPKADSQEELKVAEDKGKLPDEFQRISDTLGKELGHLINQNLITIRGDEQWLEIELKSALLFESGNADLSVPALELLGSIISLLSSRTNLIRVEGFTDSVPINTRIFPSNWELSTARASAVVHLFVEEGIDPGRIAAIGYGQYQPIADNATKEGRAANRRVVLRIAKEGKLRPRLNLVNTSAAKIAERAASIQKSNNADQPVENIQGVKKVELEGGGLLFTNNPESK